MKSTRAAICIDQGHFHHFRFDIYQVDQNGGRCTFLVDMVGKRADNLDTITPVRAIPVASAS